MEIAADKMVTTRDPIIIGKIPKSGGSDVGYQYVPNIKFFTETTLKIGNPSTKRNTEIVNRIVMDAVAMQKKVMFIPRSLI
jgi:hypothetical protein